MNKAIIYLPFSFLVIISIAYLSLSVPSFSLTLNFTNLFYPAIALTIITTIWIYSKYKSKLDTENIYKLTASTVLFSFVIWFAFIVFCNRSYTTKKCEIASYKVVGYKGRMTSGYGKLKKGKIKANQWILTIVKNGKNETFVLNKDILSENPVTNRYELQFCKGLLNTEYLNIEH